MGDREAGTLCNNNSGKKLVLKYPNVTILTQHGILRGMGYREAGTLCNNNSGKKKLVLAYPNVTIIIWFFLICIENDCLCCIAKCKAVL